MFQLDHQIKRCSEYLCAEGLIELRECSGHFWRTVFNAFSLAFEGRKVDRQLSSNCSFYCFTDPMNLVDSLLVNDTILFDCIPTLSESALSKRYNNASHSAGIVSNDISTNGATNSCKSPTIGNPLFFNPFQKLFHTSVNFRCLAYIPLGEVDGQPKSNRIWVMSHFSTCGCLSADCYVEDRFIWN